MFALVQWTTWCVDTMHHTVHKVVKHLGGQTSNAHGVCGVHGVHIFLIAKNAPKPLGSTHVACQVTVGKIAPVLVGTRFPVPS